MAVKKIELKWVPITDDTEFRLKTFYRLLAEMVFKQVEEDARDNDRAPSPQNANKNS